ncbi:MAG: extracellular solute-binding protein [Anaerolineae bacterium]|nr:extracellular solute-binding protein [Phycisphaerae bacterium]
MISGCERSDANRSVVLYTSIDQPIAAPIVREFEKRTGIRVTLVTDTEATKSVGLAEKLRAEKSNPQADVWWSNEPFHTINLAEEGLFVVCGAPEQHDVPTQFIAKNEQWAVNGFRVRVLATAGDRVHRLDDLLDPRYRDKVAIARPSAGTTGGHVAALYAAWGDQRADEFFRKLRGNGVNLLGGNGPVAEAVGAGRMQIGLTDNDDVQAARDNGGKIDPVLPDQQSLGTLIVPTTIAMVADRKSDRDAAEKLIAYLASREVEQKLIDAKFAYGSIRSPSVKAMDVDYVAVAKKMPEAVRRATAILDGRQ